VLAVAPGDPLAGRARVAAGALRERDLVSTPRGTALRATLEAACARAGFSPRVACEASDPPMLAELAARGLGVALVPASVVAARPGRLRAVPVAGPQLRGRLALAWRPEGPGSPAAQALVAHARAAVA
jgi:DNA-binding transcriptional LysR family regulator